ncbi:MAG: hypothetical protein RLZZ227_2978 [Pseudomonadota bacterium]|jgi:hypothetical protein
MTFNSLVRALAIGALLGLSGHVLAQNTALQTLPGSRHAGPGQVAASSSSFALGMTRDNGASFVSTAGVSDSVEIRGEIRPEQADVGQAADIFVVDRLLDTGQFLMRNQDGVWVPWNATVSTLVPFREKVTLTSALSVSMFSGVLGTTGNHRIFLGYLPPGGPLRYHTSGLPITITSTPTQSPLEQATAYFAANIHAPVVQSNCIACHVTGGSAQGLAMNIFVQGGASTQLDANFTQFRNLFNAKGKAYILGKVRGDNGHLGGRVLLSGSVDYRNLETFLDLLARI